MYFTLAWSFSVPLENVSFLRMRWKHEPVKKNREIKWNHKPVGIVNELPTEASPKQRKPPDQKVNELELRSKRMWWSHTGTLDNSHAWLGFFHRWKAHDIYSFSSWTTRRACWHTATAPDSSILQLKCFEFRWCFNHATINLLYIILTLIH